MKSFWFHSSSLFSSRSLSSSRDAWRPPSCRRMAGRLTAPFTQTVRAASAAAASVLMTVWYSLSIQLLLRYPPVRTSISTATPRLLRDVWRIRSIPRCPTYRSHLAVRWHTPLLQAVHLSLPGPDSHRTTVTASRTAAFLRRHVPTAFRITG